MSLTGASTVQTFNPQASKPYQRFHSHCHWLRQHLEFSDASYRTLRKLFEQQPNQAESMPESLAEMGQDYPKYQALNHKVSYAGSLARFSQHQNMEHAVIELYSTFTLFLRDCLGEIYKAQPLLVVSKAEGKQMPFSEIVNKTVEELNDHMIKEVFRRLENQRSTKKLLMDIVGGSGIVLNEPTVSTAMAYLELRHLFVHADGICDIRFHELYGSTVSCQPTKEIRLTLPLVEKAFDAVLALTANVASEMVRLGLALPLTATPSRAVLRKARRKSSKVILGPPVKGD